ncbi:non-muscle cofilin 1-like [Eucyclogobius newberryi]|uniref:non-muscle cofilin 1-like n=1 Tax=Eucyclogobius newberryi TaxID=166745 RepID=UPI003B590DD3
MASGVKVSDEIKSLFNTMKVNRSSDNAQERIRVAEFALNDAHTEIEVKGLIKEKDLEEGENLFKKVQSLMRERECTYIVYDCHYETNVTKKEDLIFIMWSCDNAKPKERMVYSSSKSALKKILDVKFEFEMHANDEITPASFVSNMGKEKIVKLEGLDVNEL